MKDTALYEHLLGLQSPWSVKSVDLSLAEQRVVVEADGRAWHDNQTAREDDAERQALLNLVAALSHRDR